MQETRDRIAELRYKAWGENHFASGSTPTTHRYTGQQQDSYINLYWYGSRWYDDALGRFAQADTLIPDAGNPQSWDRYAYALNNAVKYTDPTGHRVDPGCVGEGGCGDKANISLSKKVEETVKKKGPDILSSASYYSDVGATVISTGEQWFTDGVGLVLGGLGCLGGPEGCVAGLSAAAEADFMIAGGNPLAGLENSLGYVSFGLSFLSDRLQGNNSISSKGVFIGRDTLVSARNAALGLIPESNVDAWVNQSQLQYDINRNDGIKPGGAIQVSPSNLGELSSQIFWEDTFWQTGWQNIQNFFK